MATKTTTPVRLVKYTFLAAFEPRAGLPGADEAGLEAMGDAAAELLRDNGALTVASEYEVVEADLDLEDDDEPGLALAKHFPSDPYAVPPGKRRRDGVEVGCGKADCDGCYEPEEAGQ